MVRVTSSEAARWSTSIQGAVMVVATLLCSCAHLQRGHAKSVDVGGSAGWTSSSESSKVTPPNYGTWASSQKFLVGDSLVFKFGAGAHNVWQMNSHAAYQACDFADATLLDEGNSGFYTWTATRPGGFYFSCDKGVEGAGTHCNYNQKLAILVSNTATTPSPAQSPIKAPPPNPNATAPPSPSPVIAPPPSSNATAPSPSPVNAPPPSANVTASPSPSPSPSPIKAPPPNFNATAVPPSPAPSPIKAPSPSPSPSSLPPAKAPTILPPSLSPVLAPSPSPVLAPSPSPVLAPSLSPVLAPSPSSVLAPSPSPVLAPTPSPVLAPSPSPVLAPSPSPVLAPTPSPVLAPSPVPAGPGPVASSPPDGSSSPPVPDLPEVPGSDGPAPDSASLNAGVLLNARLWSSLVVHSVILLRVLNLW